MTPPGAKPPAAAAAGRVETSAGEALVVVALCFGLAIWSSLASMSSGFRGGSFNNGSLVWTCIVELATGGLALLYLHRRGYAVGALYPSPTGRGTLAGIGLYLAILAIDLVLANVLQVGHGPEQPIERMVHEARVSLEVVVPMAMINGTFEEVFLLGFLMRGLRQHGTAVALGTMLLVRVLYHLYQGPWGAVAVLAFGEVLGMFYLRTQRLWPVVFAHVLCDIVPFVAASSPS